MSNNYQEKLHQFFELQYEIRSEIGRVLSLLKGEKPTGFFEFEVSEDEEVVAVSWFDAGNPCQKYREFPKMYLYASDNLILVAEEQLQIQKRRESVKKRIIELNKDIEQHEDSAKHQIGMADYIRIQIKEAEAELAALDKNNA